MKLYHGDIYYTNPVEYRESNKKLDFGSGFYTTKDIMQAEDWAQQKAQGKSMLPTVTALEFSPKYDLKQKVFDGLSVEWARFIWNQKYLRKGHTFDLVEGPCITKGALAYAKSAHQFGSPFDARVAVRKATEAKETLRQIAFCSPRAVECLSVPKSKSYVITPEQSRYYFSQSEQFLDGVDILIANTIAYLADRLAQESAISTDMALDTIYHSDTYLDITNIPLEFWGESDETIYECLLKELRGNEC